MRILTICLLAGPVILVSCSVESPDLPESDVLLSGQYDFLTSDNSDVNANLDGAYIILDTDGDFEFTNPGWSNDKYGDFDIVERGTYSFAEQEEGEGFFILDIISLTPPKLVAYYTFRGGLSRLRYEFSSGEGVEYLKIRLAYDGSNPWATFEKKIPLTLEGDYAFTSSTDDALDALLGGATLSFSTDGMFELSNPVILKIAHEETTIMVSEKGPFTVMVDSLSFELYSQEPEGADSLFLLSPPGATVGASLEHGQLALVFADAGRQGITYWKAPSTVEEVEPNDSRDEATSLGGTGSYVAVGALSSGGMDQEGVYSGDYDYYRFTPGSDGSLHLLLTWEEQADLDLFLFDAEGATLAYSSLPGQSGPEAVDTSVFAEETLYALVVSLDNPALYSFSVEVP